MAERTAPLRVLSIAHTAVTRAAGRLRYHPLADDPTLEVHLVVPSRWHQFGRWYDADPADDPGVTLHALPIRLPRAGPANWYLHHYPDLGFLAAQLKPDVIHLWEEPWSVVALQASGLARRLGAALVMEVDQNILKRLPVPFELIRRHVLRRTDLVLARSNDAADVVRACGYTGPASTIGYGVDAEVFYPGDRPAAVPPLQLGYVGRVVEDKGLDDVIAALAMARSDSRLTIVGEGPHLPALQAHVARVRLGDRVSFRPWTDSAGVGTFLRGLHALVLPTRLTPSVKEQFGRVIIEAQACGTPVIGAATGAIPGVIGEGGWIVPERDPAALATLFARLCASPEEIEARGNSGVANVFSRFTYSAVANELVDGWRTAAGQHAVQKRADTPRRLR
ncbi:MAG: glycosyltransferase, partial [Pseudomonadota bacterium]|nr:glycosyltransferase [Pseudomonadota bacterium]